MFFFRFHLLTFWFRSSITWIECTCTIGPLIDVACTVKECLTHIILNAYKQYYSVLLYRCLSLIININNCETSTLNNLHCTTGIPSNIHNSNQMVRSSVICLLQKWLSHGVRVTMAQRQTNLYNLAYNLCIFKNQYHLKWIILRSCILKLLH